MLISKCRGGETGLIMGVSSVCSLCFTGNKRKKPVV